MAVRRAHETLWVTIPHARPINATRAAFEISILQNTTLHTPCKRLQETDQSSIWCIFILAVALACPVVCQGMLTLAAICLYYDSPTIYSGEQGLGYLEVAEAHGKIFTQESRQKLQDFEEGLNRQHQDSILACSRLLCVLGFAFFRTHRQNGNTLADPAAWTWLHLLRGARTSYVAVVEAGRPVDELFFEGYNFSALLPSAASLDGCGLPVSLLSVRPAVTTRLH